jgi:hypothetical protein
MEEEQSSLLYEEIEKENWKDKYKTWY